MARNGDELKKGLPKLESMLIDFLLDSGIGPKHVKGNIVLQYAPKIQELCDSITKIRQAALKEIDDSSEIPKDLEEVADKYEKENTGIYLEVGQTSIRDAFIDGAKWNREQMMKEAVECKVFNYGLPQYPGIFTTLPDGEYNEGDKVRVIILPKED